MVSLILSFLSSAGFGSVIGAVGGLANRYFDLRLKDKELAAQKVKNEHELLMRDKDMQSMQLEWEHKEQIISIEQAGQVDQRAYDALIASYGNDRATYGIRGVDIVRGLTRPGLTILLGGMALVVNGVLLRLLWNYWDAIPMPERLKITIMALEWLFFQAGTVIGWWFGARSTVPVGRLR